MTKICLSTLSKKKGLTNKEKNDKLELSNRLHIKSNKFILKEVSHYCNISILSQYFVHFQ